MDLGTTGFRAVDKQLDHSIMAAIEGHGHRVAHGVKVRSVTPPDHKSPWRIRHLYAERAPAPPSRPLYKSEAGDLLRLRAGVAGRSQMPQTPV